MTDFAFLEPPIMRDEEMELRVLEERPAIPEKGYVPALLVGMFVGGAQVGSLNLRLQDAPALQRFAGHVGYEVAEAQRGQGYAARACRLVWPLMRAYGFTEVVITCMPDNAASYRTIEKLGGVFTGLEEVPPEHPMYAVSPLPRKRYVVKL